MLDWFKHLNKRGPAYSRAKVEGCKSWEPTCGSSN